MMEPHKISQDVINSVPVIVIEGDMTSEADDSVMSFYNKLKAENSPSHIIFNFQKTSYINSAGIATLINVIQDMNDNNGKVSFVGLSNHFLKVMDIVGISDFVEIHETNEQAVK
ncbi:MAG: STAS domain-containing protein [Spirochaetota bacterium]